MFEVPINYWAVLVAGLAGVVVGAIWYGPLFGKAWMAASGIPREKLEAMKQKGMANAYLVTTILSLVSAYVLAHMVYYVGVATAAPGIGIADVGDYTKALASLGAASAFWLWLGFMVPILAGNVLWEGKSPKLFILNAAHYLVSLGIMGIILAGWR